MQDSWHAIESIALAHGASLEQVRKWRVRGVAHRWRIRLLRADLKREINEADFDRPPGPKCPERARKTPNGPLGSRAA